MNQYIFNCNNCGKDMSTSEALTHQCKSLPARPAPESARPEHTTVSLEDAGRAAVEAYKKFRHENIPANSQIDYWAEKAWMAAVKWQKANDAKNIDDLVIEQQEEIDALKHRVAELDLQLSNSDALKDSYLAKLTEAKAPDTGVIEEKNAKVAELEKDKTKLAIDLAIETGKFEATSELWLRSKTQATEADKATLRQEVDRLREALKHYSSDAMRLGSTISPRHADAALAAFPSPEVEND